MKTEYPTSSVTSQVLPFVAVFGLMYAAFGVASPFWPLFFTSQGVSAEQLGLLLASGTLTRLFAGPLVSRIADLFEALRATLALSVLLAAVAALGLISSSGYVQLLIIAVCQAAALAPITTLADALAVNASRTSTRFEYGWVRGAGSAAFVIGTLSAGYALNHDSVDLSVVVRIHVFLLATVAIAVFLLPKTLSRRVHNLEIVVPNGLKRLFQNPNFLRVLAIAALIFGSHALHDAFAVIRWSSAGIRPLTIGFLWSEAVIAEVAVFLLIGPLIIDRWGPQIAILIAASAGILRWTVMSGSTEVVVLAAVQPLHGFTFALAHLAFMRVIAVSAPASLSATAQSIYGLAAALSSAALTYGSGILYEDIGSLAFLPMTFLCVLAIPIVLTLRTSAATGHTQDKVRP